MLKSMARARRAARNVASGAEVIDFLTGAKARKLLVAAADEGEPPVAAVSQALSGIVSAKDLKNAPVKQFVGLVVRAVLEEEGYEVARSGVWLGNDPVFTTGATYRRIAKPSSSTGDDLLQRFVKMLSDEELGKLVELIHRRQGMKRKG